MSAIIGRRQVILAALVVALATAIFLNWRFTNGGADLSSVFNNSATLGQAYSVSSKKTSSGTASSTDYFATARLTRQQSHAQAVEVLKTTMNSSSATQQNKQDAQNQIDQLANNLNNETTIENLLKAKGFPNCVCFINNGAVDVVVKPKSTGDLSASDAAQIDDIITQQTKITGSKIHIIPSK